MKKITIEYFAKLREERRVKTETVETEANTVLDLFNELKVKHHFSFSAENLRVAINDEFEDWDKELNDRDSIVFIPPVAGG